MPETPTPGRLERTFVRGRFTIEQLLDLAATRATPAERQEHLKVLFGWFQDRMANFVRALIAAAVLIPVGFVLADAKGKADALDWEPVVVGMVITAVLLGYALYTNLQLNHLHREYLLAQRLLAELQDVHPELSEHVAATGR